CTRSRRRPNGCWSPRPCPVRACRSCGGRLINRALEGSAQCIVAPGNPHSSLQLCVAEFPCASFRKRKNLSLQNLDCFSAAALRIWARLACYAFPRSRTSEEGGQ